MNSPFLKQIAELFYCKYGANIHRLAFIFPNRRSGLFFRKYLSEIAHKPVFSPSILTINDLFNKLNPKQPADRIKLLFLLYDIYKRQSSSDETFDDFVFWGEMLLNDFDDIDKYLVDAKQLFTNVTDLNNIEKDFSFLLPSQIQAIRSFWSTFQPESADSNKQFFLRVWKLLYPIYTELHEKLACEGLAYEGMIYREVIESLKQPTTYTSTGSGIIDSLVKVTKSRIRKKRDTGMRDLFENDDLFGNETSHIAQEETKSNNSTENLSYEKIIFTGLNALTTAERELLKILKNQGIADFYWDYSSDKIKDKDNKASFFMKENITMFPSEYNLPEASEEPAQTEFEIIGVPSRVGQAKQLHPILGELFQKKTVSTSEALKTAIVLPDEQLLIPVINSIPEHIPRINVTLGYSLSSTPVASLMDCLQSLQKKIRRADNEVMFYHRDVISVLRHMYVSSTYPTETAELIKDIIDRNQVYISESAFGVAPLLKLLFSAPSTTAEISEYLINVLKEINTLLSEKTTTETETEVEIDKAEDPVSTGAFEREFIFHYYTIVNRMHEMIHESGSEMSSDTYFRLLKQMADFIKIPFRGEPLSGLQVMGVLETRVLDFENIIILSSNEGIFPSKNAANSFIPYHLRRGFGLPTQEHQESIWAYHFYRMIYRAKRVIMLYDTRTDGLQSGEVSRFVHQLKFHYKTPIKEKLLVYNISSSRIEPFSKEKDEETALALAAYEKDKSLSASAINIYLDCPLKFYFSVIKGIEEEDAVSESLESDTFGTILHRVMELSYKPFHGKTVTADLLKLAADEKNMTENIQAAFAKDFFHSDKPLPLSGQSYLYGETIRKYANKILKHDSSLTPFRYICSEKLFRSSLELPDGRVINIKGFIDRIDNINDTIRIIDYKSGKPATLTFNTMESLFDKTEKERQKAIMQVFLYAWVYMKDTGSSKIQPAVYYIRDLFRQAGFDPYIRCSSENEKVLINNFADYSNEFEDNLRSCINEMFDVSKPFTQTPNIKHCDYCPFTKICGR
jgi:ATP-dependent nuclease, subunit B